MRLVLATRAKITPNLLSLSRMKYFGPTPKAVASRRGTRSPSVGGRSRHADMDHSARVQFDHEEGEQRAEEEIGDREEVAGPDLLGMSAEEGLPGLPTWPGGAHGSHVLLNGTLADAYPQLE